MEIRNWEEMMENLRQFLWKKLRGDDGKPKAIFNERNWEEMMENLRQFLMKEIERWWKT